MAGLLKSLGPRSSRQSDAAILKKSAKTQIVNTSVKGGTSVLDKITTITALVSSKLGKYKDKYTLLRTDEEVTNYFDDIIKVGSGSIDTETNSLNTMLCTLAGICLYAPGLKPAYIPLHHISYITGVESPNQVDDSLITENLQRCKDSGVKWIMHNAKFDIRVIKNQLSIEIPCFWDTMLAAKCLNENEPAGLKALHLKYCPTEDKEALSYDKLFEGIPFTHIPITTGYLYAAGDGVKTYELYEYQKKYLNRRILPGPYEVFSTVEMPLIPVIAEMEDTGIAFDKEFAQQLSAKYTIELMENEENFYQVLDMYKTEIEVYKQRNPNHKLGDPINIGSPTQIAILLYDILGLTSPDKKKPRGTGEDILVALDVPLSKAILNYRGTSKLLSTYVDKLPAIVNPVTQRIHCSFNQYGAVTGRLSSSEPNMQNIPAKNKEIRKMFTASEGYALISNDFSQQEPRVLADRSGDRNLIQAYLENKDIYSWIASSIYHVEYDECKEFRQDGTKNPEGKKRRDSVKSIILGIMYSRGAAAIAEQLGVSVKEAQKIVDKFFATYPLVKVFIDSTISNAKKNGYVETAWGRKRRLPEMLLEPYEFKLEGGKPMNFDPLAFNQGPINTEVDNATKLEYTKRLEKTYSYREKNNIREEAKGRGITIKDNGGFIAEASRQCVNSIVQGTSADITKRAMIIIGNDQQLKDWGCRLLLQVHDELIAEAPEQYAQQVADRIAELMIQAAAEKIKVPMKVDSEITRVWYGKELELDEVLSDSIAIEGGE